MGRFIILSTLLLGLVGLVNGQFLGQNDNRQEFAPVDGCVPGMSNGACPVRMECFADGNFENGGRCDCKLKWMRSVYSFLSLLACSNLTASISSLYLSLSLSLASQATLSGTRLL